MPVEIKTKIIATVGPASDKLERLAQLVEAGVSVFRLNMAHGRYEWHTEVMGRIRQLRTQLGGTVAVLADLDRLRVLGYPVCVGVSRKSFIGALTGEADPAKRLPGSIAATTAAVLAGAHVIRTHDVAETVQATRIAEAIRRRGAARAA